MDLDTTQVEAAQTAAPAASDAAIPASPESVVGTPATPAPAEAAVVETPAAAPAGGEAETELSYAEYNKLVEAQLKGEEPAKPEVAAEVEPAEEAAEAPEGAEAAAETSETPVVVIRPDMTLEEVQEAEAALIEQFELTPEFQQLNDYKSAKIAELSAQLEPFAATGNVETIAEIAAGFARMWETEVDPVTGVATVNPVPALNAIRKAYSQEFRPLMEAGLSAASDKVPGATIFEEIMIDIFGGEKAETMLKYGRQGEPLPIIPANLLMPQGLDESHKEAFVRLSDVKREQIQRLVNEINDLQDAQEEASDWRKDEIAMEIRERKALLDDEFQAIKDKQQLLNNDRERQALAQRQEAARVAEFRTKVAEEYNTELFGLADALVADLAPRLSYADGDTQVSQARNIMARINNALAFSISEDGRVVEDPMASRYAKQLVDEGVKFDFAKGRDLLQKHYQATEVLTQLKLRNANPLQIEKATRDRNKIMFDIKTEQKVLVGQLASKYVKSNAAAIGKQVGELQAKKQAVRAITNGKPETSVKRLDPKDEIARYNRELERQRATNGEQLFEMHSR